MIGCVLRTVGSFLKLCRPALEQLVQLLCVQEAVTHFIHSNPRTLNGGEVYGFQLINQLCKVIYYTKGSLLLEHTVSIESIFISVYDIGIFFKSWYRTNDDRDPNRRPKILGFRIRNAGINSSDKTIRNRNKTLFQGQEKK